MKKLLTTACIVTGALSLHAQNANLDFKYGLKFSNIATIAHYEGSITETYAYKFNVNTWVAPAISLLVKNKKHNFHEFELSSIGLNHSEVISQDPIFVPDPYTSKSSSSHITIQYQYIQNFLKNKNTRWMPSLGLGVSAEYSLTKGSNLDKYVVYNKSSTTYLTFIGYLTPGVSYNISKRFFASAAVPVALFRSLSNFTKVTDDHYPENNQNSQDNQFTAFPTFYNFKLSLGLKL